MQNPRQVEFSLAGPYSSCLRSMLFRGKYHTLFGLNSTIKGLTEFVKPLKIECLCQVFVGSFSINFSSDILLIFGMPNKPKLGCCSLITKRFLKCFS